MIDRSKTGRPASLRGSCGGESVRTARWRCGVLERVAEAGAEDAAEALTCANLQLTEQSHVVCVRHNPVGGQKDHFLSPGDVPAIKDPLSHGDETCRDVDKHSEMAATGDDGRGSTGRAK
eukprot:3795625-Pleurochrysis_carterae.AAC.2